MNQRVNDWVADLLARETHGFSRPEFFKAIRALSARYVEARATLARRSAVDSAGKRAAFAAFFAPVHFVTTRAIVRALDAGDAGVREIVDLGCGTGAASAAWALECPVAPAIRGIDCSRSVLDESKRTWRAFGLEGRARRADLVAAALERARSSPSAGGQGTALLLAWTVNELDAPARRALHDALLTLAGRGDRVLVVEPLSRAAVPWWEEWASAWHAAGGRADEWKFDVDLPPAIAEISQAAGFRRESLGARTIWHPGRPGRSRVLRSRDGIRRVDADRRGPR
jgi:hypothetical protein